MSAVRGGLWYSTAMTGATWLPETLSHSLQGNPPRGPNTFVLIDGRLQFSLPEPEVDPSKWRRIATPTAEAWGAFWRDCDAMGIWHLPETFGNTQVFDGLQVNVELAFTGRKVRAKGQCFGAPSQIVERVRRFHEGLQRLAGFEPDASFALTWDYYLNPPDR